MKQHFRFGGDFKAGEFERSENNLSKSDRRKEQNQITFIIDNNSQNTTDAQERRRMETGHFSTNGGNLEKHEITGLRGDSGHSDWNNMQKFIPIANYSFLLLPVVLNFEHRWSYFDQA